MENKIDISNEACEARILKRNKKNKIWRIMFNVLTFAFFVTTLTLSILGEVHWMFPIVCFVLFCMSFAPDIKTVSSYGETEIIHCPKCGCDHIHFHKKGFSTTKALIGASLLGMWGVLGGTIGENKIIGTCLKCGKQFVVKKK